VGDDLLIQITPQLRILVAIEAIDGRKGIDSLAQLCREKLDTDPFSGCLFIFRSRSAKSIRILAYDLCSVSSNVQSVDIDLKGRGYFRGLLHSI
jgi:hypothetical protein